MGVVFIQKQALSQKSYLDFKINRASNNLNYGNMNAILKEYKNPLTSTQIGGAFQIGISPRFSLVPEFYFIRKGGKLVNGNNLTLIESTLKFNTIELPFLTRIHLGKIYINAGPSIGYILSGQQSIENISRGLDFTKPSEYKRFDLGVQLGGGLELPLKQKELLLT